MTQLAGDLEGLEAPQFVAPPVPEITWQSVIGAFLVSSLVAGSYPYVVLKLGMGPNVSVVSAFLGAIAIASRLTQSFKYVGAICPFTISSPMPDWMIPGPTP
jgi:hypothetical protein